MKILIKIGDDSKNSHQKKYNIFGLETWVHKKVRTGQISAAYPRKNWLCSICNTTIYSGMLAYHCGDYRDGKRTYICQECVHAIQEI